MSGTDTDPSSEERPAPSAPARRQWWPPTVSSAVGALFALWGLYIGAGALSDNSFLTHLATGRLILDAGIPSRDPYSFTASGSAWTVQSWLVSLLYGLAERVAGETGLHLLIMAMSALLAGLVWALTRPATSIVPRVAIAAMAIGVGSAVWSERPLLVGLICLALVLLSGEGRLDPRWLLAVLWVWVNAHGSFPLGLVALGCLAMGRYLDGDDPATEVRALRWAAGGIALGIVNPLGPALLLFPFHLLSRQDILANIVEWQSPDFGEGWARLFLVEIAVAVVALVRHPRYRVAVPLVVFVAAALLGARNVGVASIVLVPGLASSLAGLGSLTGSERSIVSGALSGVVAILASVVVVATLGGNTFDLRRYPVAEVDLLEEAGVLPSGVRLAAPDYVGNYLEFRYGDEASVFVDDRYDMFPRDVPADYRILLGGRPGWQDVLDERGVDVVLWPEKEPLSALLAASGEDWKFVPLDDAARTLGPDGEEPEAWVVYCRQGSAACGQLRSED